MTTPNDYITIRLRGTIARSLGIPPGELSPLVNGDEAVVPGWPRVMIGTKDVPYLTFFDLIPDRPLVPGREGALPLTPGESING